MGIRKTQAEYVEQVDALEKGFTVIGTYFNRYTPIAHRCSKGHEWPATPANILSGTGCPHCNGKMKKTHDDYVEALAVLKAGFRPLEKYITANTPILHECPKGHKFTITPSKLKRVKNGCRDCSKTKKKTHHHRV